MYDSSVVGSIVIIKDIVFDFDNKRGVDHAYKKGRPCLIIHSDDEFDYFLVMTHEIRKEFASHYYKCNINDYQYRYEYKYRQDTPNYEKYTKVHEGYINLQNIYKRPVSGYGSNEIGKLKLSSYKRIVEKLKRYNKSELDDLINGANNIRGGR